MVNNREKTYLKRISGTSLELLVKNLKDKKKEYRIIDQEPHKNNFRSTLVLVKMDLEDIYSNYSILPSSGVAKRQYNKEKEQIEVEAIYNSVTTPLNTELKIDENYVEFTEEYARNLGIDIGQVPLTYPRDNLIIRQL